MSEDEKQWLTQAMLGDRAGFNRLVEDARRPLRAVVNTRYRIAQKIFTAMQDN